jgi:predicted amidohydrolase YtcJ
MHADALFTGGAVYTQDPSVPRAEALATRAERILAVGSAAELADLRGPGTRVVNLAGRALLPGFVDAHIHFGAFAMSRRQLDLESAATLEQGLATLRATASGLPAQRWIEGRGWDRNRWGRLPTAAELDSAVGARPAALRSHDGHSLWVSTAALQQAGITRNTPDPPGGRVERDESGEPIGILFETARRLAWSAMPAATVAEMVDAIREALPVAAAAGLTGIHNLEDRVSLRAFGALRRAEELSLRVFHGVPHEALSAAIDAGLETGLGDEWLRIGLLKLFADGALGSHTAHVLEPYIGQASEGNRGLPRLSSDELRENLGRAARAGLGVAVHAIGDAAVRSVLDAMEWARRNEPAADAAATIFRVEHAQLIDPADVPRFAELDVVASMQPIHAVGDWRAADALWGARAGFGYAWRSLLDAGALLAFGTDAPIEPIEPLRSLHAAVTRQEPSGEPAGGWYPEQRLSLAEAIRAYTVGAVQAERGLGSRGTLTSGKLADLVVLSRDPFAVEPAALLETNVDVTMVGGRIVHADAHV